MPKKLPRSATQRQDDEARFARLKHVADDPFPHTPVLLRAITKALLKRITRMDPKQGDWCRLVIKGLAARETSCDPMDVNFMRREVSKVDMMELSGEWKAHAPGHLPALVRLQRDHLKNYFRRERDYPQPASLKDWVAHHRNRIYEELSFWPCLCVYPKDFGGLDLGDDDLRENAVRLTILATLHNVSPATLKPLLKPAARTTPPPSYYK